MPLNNEESARMKKAEQLRANNNNPYPARIKRDKTIAAALGQFDALEKSQEKFLIAGRIRLIRLHGKAIFAHIEDESGTIQLYFKYDVVGEKQFEIIRDMVDMGDFLSVHGSLFKTHKGEKTILVERFEIISKALLPLPEKWSGLEDIETRFRKRYLDLLSNKEVKELFYKRTKLIKLLRQFFDEQNYIEVDTPILQPLAGGATAKPFITRHNALDIDLYLRVAPELYLKRLIIGGYEKVYEIARCFRNEGIDRAHNPEFTQIEFYEAYRDYTYLMELTEKLFAFLIQEINGSLDVVYDKQKIDFKPPYERLTYREAIKKYANIDIMECATVESLQKAASQLKIAVEKEWGYGKILDEIFKETARKRLIGPVFITDHPIELSPLAKKKEDNPRFVERFQLIVAGFELCNAFSELNDPLDQEARFIAQEKDRAQGDEEAQMKDNDFVEALKHGMPPTAGEGIGIDRLLAILCDIHNIKEVILFPTLRPKQE